MGDNGVDPEKYIVDNIEVYYYPEGMTNEKLIQLVVGEHLRHAGPVPNSIVSESSSEVKTDGDKDLSAAEDVDAEYKKVMKGNTTASLYNNSLSYDSEKVKSIEENGSNGNDIFEGSEFNVSGVGDSELFARYERNIINGRTAIDRNLVDEGYFNYFSKKQIKDFSNSKRILIDGVSAQFEDFVRRAFRGVFLNTHSSNNRKILYLGTVGDKLADAFNSKYGSKHDIRNYNLAFDSDYLWHAKGHHGDVESEINRGQKAIEPETILKVPYYLSKVKSDDIDYLGVNDQHQDVYCFTYEDEAGTKHMVELINDGKHQLGFASLYENATLDQIKKAHSITSDVSEDAPLSTSMTSDGTEPNLIIDDITKIVNSEDEFNVSEPSVEEMEDNVLMVDPDQIPLVTKPITNIDIKNNKIDEIKNNISNDKNSDEIRRTMITG